MRYLRGVAGAALRQHEGLWSGRVGSLWRSPSQAESTQSYLPFSFSPRHGDLYLSLSLFHRACCRCFFYTFLFPFTHPSGLRSLTVCLLYMLTLVPGFQFCISEQHRTNLYIQNIVSASHCNQMNIFTSSVDLKRIHYNSALEHVYSFWT